MSGASLQRIHHLRHLLGIRIPVLQAPIGSMATPELAIAVSRAGGLGALALTWCSRAEAEAAIGAVRAATPTPFQVNFVLAFPAHNLELALDAGVEIVTFSWGLPTPDQRRRVDTITWGAQVGSVEAALRALDSGARFLICQGVEAGGHVEGTTPLAELLPQVVAAAHEVPVIAAGGIGNGAKVSEVLAAGAAGAMLGTRFVASHESAAHPSYRRAIETATAGDTVLTGCFDGGWPDAPHRALRNRTIESWEATGKASGAARPDAGVVVATRGDGSPIYLYDDTPPRFDTSGDLAALPHYAGTSVDAIGSTQSAARIVAELWRDALATLAGPAIEHHLIVYGSLAPGRSHHARLAGLPGRWHRGTIRGTLVPRGWGAPLGFPVLHWDEAERGHPAWLLESPALPTLWAELDAFEGSDYRRDLIPFEVAETGEPMIGHVYLDASESPPPPRPPPGPTADIWDLNGWKLKVYADATVGDTLDTPMVAAARTATARRLPPATTSDRQPRLGFVILQRLETFDRVTLGWWEADDTLRLRVLRAPREVPYVFVEIIARDETASPWERRIAGFEGDCWQSCKTASGQPDEVRYLATRFAGD